MSALNKWISIFREADVVSSQDQELKELELNVGHRRIVRLMRQNGISVIHGSDRYLTLPIVGAPLLG